MENGRRATYASVRVFMLTQHRTKRSAAWHTSDQRFVHCLRGMHSRLRQCAPKVMPGSLMDGPEGSGLNFLHSRSMRRGERLYSVNVSVAECFLARSNSVLGLGAPCEDWKHRSRNCCRADASSGASIVPLRSTSKVRKMLCHCSTYLKTATNLASAFVVQGGGGRGKAIASVWPTAAR